MVPMDTDIQNTNPTSEVETEEMQSQTDVATNLITIENLIKKYIVDIEKVQQQLKTQKEMFDASFENDAAYAEADEKVKEVTKTKNASKQKLMKNPSITMIFDRMKELKQELKDMREDLSDYLQQYYKLANTTQIIDDNGEIREIIVSTKLVKKGGKFRP
jgi:hypothetical protein